MRDFERIKTQAKPNLVLKMYRAGSMGDNFRLINHGEEARNIKLANDESITCNSLYKGREYPFSLTLGRKTLEFNYEDTLGHNYTTIFEAKGNCSS